MHFLKALRPGVVLHPAARHFENTHLFESIASRNSMYSGGPIFRKRKQYDLFKQCVRLYHCLRRPDTSK